jgi:hypothetical protein
MAEPKSHSRTQTSTLHGSLSLPSVYYHASPFIQIADMNRED